MKQSFGLACVMLLVAITARGEAPDGRAWVEASLQRHALPSHLYEEQSMILTDRQGHHTVRSTRFYAQSDGTHQLKLLVIETPFELKGSRQMLEPTSSGSTEANKADVPVFGSDFSVADLAGEKTTDHRYETSGGIDLDRVPHHRVRAVPATISRSRSSPGERLLYLRKDNLFISRVDYLDREGRLIKRLSYRDPRANDSGAWHAGMLLMENFKEGRRSLLKVDRRVESPDYIPAAVFAGLTPPRP